VVHTPIEVDRATARRFLVRRHLLAPPRGLPSSIDSVRAVMARIGSLQFDPIDVTGRNHDLVLASRIAGYRRAWTDELLYGERWLFETYNKGLSLLPTAELPYYRIFWDREQERHGPTTFVEHADLVAELLERIRRDGPMAATDVEPRAAIDWYWRPTNQVRAVLEALAEAGVLALARRDGNRRVYDLTERLFPADLLAVRVPADEQRQHKLLSRYRAHGLLGMTGGQAEIWIGTAPTAGERYAARDALIDAGRLVPVRVEGVRGERLILAEERPMLDAAARSVAAGVVAATEDGRADGVAFLAALDPLVWDRELLRSLFDFDYLWEVYVPAAKRKWGYYVLPILWGDRFVGRIEPRIERRTGILRVLDVWWEPDFEPVLSGGFSDAFVAALLAHAAFLDATRIAWPRAARHRALGAVVRAALGTGGRLPTTPERSIA
jgi:uncharacterized protein YcaQ